jgi:hypothetical protein
MRYLRPPILGYLILVFLIFRCGEGMAQGGPSINAITINNPHAALQYFKAALRRMPQEPIKPVYPFLDSCLYSDDPGGTRNADLMANLHSIASRELRLSSDLERVGYPRAVWEQALQVLIHAQVTIATSPDDYANVQAMKRRMLPHDREFVRVLNAYRDRSGINLLKYEVNAGDCGGDWIGMFTIRTTPSNGTVTLIREYYYQLCVVANIPPYSARCDKWYQAGPRDAFPQGTYRYLARWESEEECAKKEFVHNGSGDIERPQVNTIVRTGHSCER